MVDAVVDDLGSGFFDPRNDTGCGGVRTELHVDFGRINIEQIFVRDPFPSDGLEKYSLRHS